MKREGLARELAKETKMPAAAARDEVDELVHKIIRKLRQGRQVKLPGLGRIVSRPR